MIPYGEPPSNQSMLPLGISRGEANMQGAREWVRDNPDSWERYKRLAKYMSRYGEPSPNFIRELTRHGFDAACGMSHDVKKRVSVRNSFAPCLARIAMEQDPSIRFRMARSSSDGYVDVEL